MVLLLGLILAVAIIGVLALSDTSRKGEAVMKDNFRSVEYSRAFLSALHDFPQNRAPERMEQALILQRENITEPGEDSLSHALWAQYQQFAANPSDSVAKAMRGLALTIMDLNLRATREKNDRLIASVTTNNQRLTVGYTIVFLILVSLMFTFPNAILHPIHSLSVRIREVAAGNYDQRVEVEDAGEMRDLASAFNEMAAQLTVFRQSTLAEVMRERRRLETVLESLRDALLILDESDRLLYANPVARKIMGLPEGDLRGLPATSLYATHDLFRDLISPVSPDKQPLVVVMEQKERFFQRESMHIDATDPASGAPLSVGKVYLLHDVTQFHELDRAKTDFLATISHELKTPLSSINLSMKLLADERVGALSPAQAELAAKGRQEVKRMLEVVGELIQLSQLESGRILLKPVSVPVEVLLNRAMDCVEIQAANTGIRMVKAPECSQPVVWADPEKTVWVLVNLLGNAIRFSPPGGTIHLTCAAHPDSVDIGVTDEGPGIAPDMQDRIFERYVTFPAREAGGKTQGSGLGLAIAREFMHAQGGEVSVKSQPGAGATFVVRFRLG